VNSKAALSKIQTLVMSGWVEFTAHARQEMRDEMTTAAEVLAAIRYATDCIRQPNGRYRIITRVDLKIIVELQNHVVIVTVFGRE